MLYSLYTYPLPLSELSNLGNKIIEKLKGPKLALLLRAGQNT